MLQQINNQPPESRIHRQDGALEIVGSPWYTIQGEGPFAGTPAVFVRLRSCNLACPDCDTDYTSDGSFLSPVQLTDAVVTQFPMPTTGWVRADAVKPLVVVTGGEPFRQRLGPVVRELCARLCRVQVETNGTYFEDDFPWAGDVTLVVSPKVGRVHESLRPYVRHLKYVVEAGRTDPKTGLPVHVLGNRQPVQPPWPEFKGTVWVQPADMQNDVCNKANMDECVASAKKFGYRVSVQSHKILGVD